MVNDHQVTNFLKKASPIKYIKEIQTSAIFKTISNKKPTLSNCKQNNICIIHC